MKKINSLVEKIVVFCSIILLFLYFSCGFKSNTIEVENVFYTIDNGNINLYWDNVVNEEICRIEIEVYEADTKNLVDSYFVNADATFFPITNLSYYKKYFIIIKTCDYDSNYSKGIKITVEIKENNKFPVYNLNALIKDKSIDLNWNNNYDESLKKVFIDVNIKDIETLEMQYQLDLDTNNFNFVSGINGVTYVFNVYTIDCNNCISDKCTITRMFMDFSLFNDIPIINIVTDSGSEPSCDYISNDGYWGSTITNNYYLTGNMNIKLNNITLYESGSYEKNKSGIKIKIRGNTSAYSSRKPYKIKLEKKDDLLSKVLNRSDDKYNEKEWLLLNATKLRTSFGLDFSRFMGIEWEPEYSFCMVIMNGDFKGLYMLTESIAKGEGRLNISDDGFIIENDPYFWNEDVSFRTTYQHPCLAYTFKYPDSEKITEEVYDKVNSYMNKIDYKIYLNIPCGDMLNYKSAAVWLLTHDVLGTADYAGSNMYLYKSDMSTESKLELGPLWDFDSIFSTKNNWCNVHTLNMFYPCHLVNFSDFNDEYKSCWETKEKEIDDFLEQFENKYTIIENQLNSCRELTYSMYNNKDYKTVNEDIEEIKNWFTDRIEWIEKNIESL